jgi:hypothetical protein
MTAQAHAVVLRARIFAQLALSLTLIVASAATPAGSLRFHCDATESATAVYHLACLAGHIPCTRNVFERFWHDRRQWTPAHQRELEAWTIGLKKVEDAAGPLGRHPMLATTAPSFQSSMFGFGSSMRPSSRDLFQTFSIAPGCG